jgi:hypothetical protein|tara:strand:+ start:278 stop:892 length:615 start_codon:yes stop_codon:yes gene_type:complete
MKVATLASILSLKIRPHNFAGIGRTRWSKRLLIEQVRMPVRVIQIPGPEIIMIRHKVHTSLCCENAMYRLHRVVLHKPPLVVPLLGPRIGEIQMQNIHDTGDALETNELAAIVMEQQNVGELIPSRPVRCIPVELTGPLDTKKVGIRLDRGLLNQKRALAGSNLNFKRLIRCGKQSAWIQRRPVRFREIIRLNTVPTRVVRTTA